MDTTKQLSVAEQLQQRHDEEQAELVVNADDAPAASLAAPGGGAQSVGDLRSRLASRLDELRSKRAKDLQRVRALNLSLDQNLLDVLQMRAATLRPELVGLCSLDEDPAEWLRQAG